MSERDAFGRKKNEDPVESMGWGPSGTTARARDSEPVEVRLPSNEGLPGMGDPGSGGPGIGVPDMEGVPGTRARPGHTFPEHRAVPTVPGSASDVRVGRVFRGCLPALVVLVVVAGIGIGIVGAILDAVDDSGVVDAIDSIEDLDTPEPGIPGTPALPQDDEDPPGSDAPASPALTGPPTGFRSDSLLLRRNLRAAIDRIDASDGTRLEMLRVAPEQINAILRGRDGGRVIVLIGSDGTRQRIASGSAGGVPRDRTAPLSAVNTAAPYRASRSAAGRSRLPASSVNYLLFNFAGSRGWNVYLKNGDFYQADARGRITRQFAEG